MGRLTQESKGIIAGIMSAHLGQKKCYGVTDCNLLVLKCFEPDMHDKIYKRYTTTRGGARVANDEFGYCHLPDFIRDNYKEIDRAFALPYDVVVFGKRDVGIFTQFGIFCIKEDETFGYIKESELDFKLYRKE